MDLHGVCTQPRDVDYYKLLGCDPSSSVEQIATEFKQLARRFHPDKVEGSEEKKEAERFFVKLEKARTVLLDPRMRELYDQWRGVGMCVSFDDWVALQSRVHASMHWTVEKHTPSLQETSEGDQHVPSHHGNQGHTSLGKGDGSDPLKEFRQESASCSELVNRFRNYGI
ncbi:hypothetical protein EMCRGX_G027933 [Ephydatia muelleri]